MDKMPVFFLSASFASQGRNRYTYVEQDSAIVALVDYVILEDLVVQSPGLSIGRRHVGGLIGCSLTDTGEKQLCDYQDRA